LSLKLGDSQIDNIITTKEKIKAEIALVKIDNAVFVGFLVKAVYFISPFTNSSGISISFSEE